MIIRSLKKRLSKAEVYAEINDPGKVVIRNIVDYYRYLDDLENDPGFDKKELIYKPPPRTSAKETFLDLLIKHDSHYAGYVGDEVVKNLLTGRSEEDKYESYKAILEKSKENYKETKEQLKMQTEGSAHIQPTNENEPAHEKIKRRKALECCGSFG